MRRRPFANVFFFFCLQQIIEKVQNNLNTSMKFKKIINVSKLNCKGKYITTL
jgi:hypothetical protein